MLMSNAISYIELVDINVDLACQILFIHYLSHLVFLMLLMAKFKAFGIKFLPH